MTKPKHASPEPSSPSELIARLARELDASEVAYLLIGGRAVIEQGYPRTTKDIDIELALGPWDFERLSPVLQKLGLRFMFPRALEVLEQSLLLPVVEPRSGMGIDFAFSPSEYLDVAIARAPRHDIAGYPVAVAAVEDLIIRKVIANRPQDRQDIDQLLLRHAPRLDRAYIDRWLVRFEEVTEQPLRAAFAELLEGSRR